MTNEFTAIVERDGEWYITYCPEVPGANGQGKTKEEALESLSEAIALILEDRREEGLRGVPPDATLDKVTRERERKRGQEGSNLLLAFNPYMASLPVPGGSQNIPSVQVRVETSNSE